MQCEIKSLDLLTAKNICPVYPLVLNNEPSNDSSKEITRHLSTEETHDDGAEKKASPHKNFLSEKIRAMGKLRDAPSEKAP